MKLIGRVAAARMLGMTANALSCRVAKRDYRDIPEPIVVSGCFKWSEEQIMQWVKDRFDALNGESKLKPHKKRGPGRPPKTGGLSCP